MKEAVLPAVQTAAWRAYSLLLLGGLEVPVEALPKLFKQGSQGFQVPRTIAPSEVKQAWVRGRMAATELQIAPLAGFIRRFGAAGKERQEQKGKHLS